MSDFKLSALKLKLGEHMEMLYDFGCEQVFDIELIGEAGMQQGKDMSYPRIIDGAEPYRCREFGKPGSITPTLTLATSFE